MPTNIKNIVPKYITSPGDILADEIEARGWTQDDLSNILGVSIQTINKIIKGKTGITTEMAVALGAAFNQAAEFWLNLDARYRSLKYADKTEEVKQKTMIYDKMPVAEMSKRKWIVKQNLIPSVLEFFRCKSLNKRYLHLIK